MEIRKKTKIKFLVFSAFVVVVYLIFTFLLFRPSLKNNIPIQAKPLPKTLEENYSSLNKIVPGKSTLDDVIKIAGKPQDTSVENGKTYLYFNTPFKELKNTVLMENGVVVYAYEWIFGNQRGTYDEKTSPLGSPSLTLYTNDVFDPPWLVFLKKGAMMKVSDKIITEAVYFVPQDREAFLRSVIVSDLGLSTQPPEGELIFGPE